MSSPPRLRDEPLVTIVTPSFNQGRFIADAVDSVLRQDYPHIEYLVVDGGSDDDTLDVLARYGDRIDWVSEPDRGQADAINKGFRRARGDILAWLNADDVYAPGAIARVVEAFRADARVGLVYGNGSILDADGDVLGGFEEIEPFSLWRLVHGLDYILQPAAFFRRDAALEVGLLDEGLEFGLDWDLWIRLAEVCEVRYLQDELACSRVYPATKTSTGGWRRIDELRRLAARHAGQSWTPGVKLYALDTLGGQLADLGPRLWRRGVRRLQRALAATIVQRQPLHADGWLGPRGKLLVPRRWGSAQIELEAQRLPRRRDLEVEVETEGRRLARRLITAPGRVPLALELPGGDAPFVELDVTCNFSFRTPPDRRRLSLRCLEVRPGAGITASDKTRSRMDKTRSRMEETRSRKAESRVAS